MFLIYKHTNKINKKCYIGYTSKTIEWRWQRHLRSAKTDLHYKFHFCNALRKYSSDIWEHEILESNIETREQAINSEIKWIIYFDSANNDKGYNTTSGGNGGKPHTESYKEAMSKRFSGDKNPFFGKKHSKDSLEKIQNKVYKRIVSKYDETGKLIKTFQSIKDATENNIKNYAIIYKSCKSKKYYLSIDNCIWKFGNIDKIEIDKLINNKQEKKIISQYDQIGNLIETFSSLYKARKKTKIVSISSAAKNESSAGGFFWRFGDQPKIVILNKKIQVPIQVSSYDKDGNIIKTYNSLKKAEADSTDRADSISYFCKLNGKYAKPREIYWFFGNTLKVSILFKESRKLNQISQFDINGNLIKIHKNIRAASQETKLSSELIRLDCFNKTSLKTGFIWKDVKV